MLTATGCRPEAFALCKRWMAAQTYSGPVRWVIVDDGATPIDSSDARGDWQVDHYRRTPYWRCGQNTQPDNLLFGLDKSDGPLAIIEDDDYYAPGYLDAVAGWLEKAELVGERSSRYYHVGARLWHDNKNMRHASLCATAMRDKAVEKFRECVLRRGRFIDMDLWREFSGSLLMGTRLHVGIKGLPGRPGIGVGHSPTRGKPDPFGEVLRGWIGVDAEAYLVGP